MVFIVTPSDKVPAYLHISDEEDVDKGNPEGNEWVLAQQDIDIEGDFEDNEEEIQPFQPTEHLSEEELFNYMRPDGDNSEHDLKYDSNND